MIFIKAAIALYLSAIALAASLGRDSQEANTGGGTFRVNLISIAQKLIIGDLAGDGFGPSYRL